jgi:proline racemase
VEIAATDYHTAGEPFRIVEEGSVEIPGRSVLDRRDHASFSDDVDRARRLLCHEPRGHADMYGGFVVPADDDGADFGVVFWHKDGYSTACGHGTIALAAWAVECGRIEAPADGAVEVTIDVPSGRVVARVTCRAGAVERIAFRNVPAYVIARGVAAGEARVDVAYGGAIYAFVPAIRLGLPIAPDALPELIRAGREIKAALEGTDVAVHPDDPRLSGIYGTVIHEELGPAHHRNVVVFGDGEVDRSPTGSATSARTALAWSAAPRVACSPRSRAGRSGRASTVSSWTRGTSWASASCCGDIGTIATSRPSPRDETRSRGRGSRG